MIAQSYKRLSKIYYSPRGYWKGFAAIKKLAQAAKVSEDVARNWLGKQALWQIYLPAPRYIPRPKFDVPVPNQVHQTDLLYLPRDRPPRSRRTFKYALTVVDVASRFKEAEPLATKEAREVAAALEQIYSRSLLSWPKLFQKTIFKKSITWTTGPLLKAAGFFAGLPPAPKTYPTPSSIFLSAASAEEFKILSICVTSTRSGFETLKTARFCFGKSTRPALLG